MLGAADLERFLSKVEQGPNCWVWQGTVQANHGKFSMGGKSKAASCVAFRHFIGEIPPRHLVRHTCGNSLCVRPEHLTLTEGTGFLSDEERDRVARERFCAQVARRGADDCWEYLGAKGVRGYGVFWLGRRNVHAHRASWVFAEGPIPEGQCVCHRCDNPPCVNPRHLFLGTSPENTADKVAKGRQSRGEQHSISKLTEQAVREIRARRIAGATQQSLALAFGVSKFNIQCIEFRRTWKHLPLIEREAEHLARLRRDAHYNLRKSSKEGTG